MGKFFILRILARKPGCASLERSQRRGKPLQHIPPNWKKQKARQAFEVRMHSEAHGMRRRSEANSPAVHRYSRSGAPTCGYFALGTGPASPDVSTKKS